MLPDGELSLSPPRILIVDDEPEAIAGLKSWLDRHIAPTALVSDVTAAEQVLASAPIDLLLCDVHMPGNRGLAWVRKQLSEADAPALFIITGQPELEITIAAANLPIAGFLLKPPDYQQLEPLLRESLKHREEHRQLRATLKQAVEELAAAGASHHAPLQSRLREVINQLDANPHLPRGATQIPASIDWTSVLRDTVDVLEKTKSNFRSKEIANLRRRLESLLTGEN